jgi:hypothetical protein
MHDGASTTKPFWPQKWNSSRPLTSQAKACTSTYRKCLVYKEEDLKNMDVGSLNKVAKELEQLLVNKVYNYFRSSLFAEKDPGQQGQNEIIVKT